MPNATWRPTWTETLEAARRDDRVALLDFWDPG